MPPITNQMNFPQIPPECYLNHTLFSTLRPKLEEQGLDHMAHYYYYMDPLVAKYTILVARSLQWFREHPDSELVRKKTLVYYFDSFCSEIGTRYPYPFLSLDWMTQLAPHTLVASYKFQLMLNRLLGEQV